MLKANLHSLARPKIFWPSILILLIACITLYIFKEKEKTLRIKTENELTRTIEAKRIIENNLVEAKKEITAKDEQIKLTLDKLEKEIIVRKEAETRLISLASEKQALEEKVEKLTAALPKTIELEKIVVKPRVELIGRVLTFDRENTFVAIDLGSEDNLKLGDILSVYRDGKFIGKAQIEKIEERSCVAVILAPWRNVEFKESDEVRKL